MRRGRYVKGKKMGKGNVVNVVSIAASPALSSCSECLLDFHSAGAGHGQMRHYQLCCSSSHSNCLDVRLGAACRVMR